jgi:sugar lactone lactonase YvrE
VETDPETGLPRGEPAVFHVSAPGEGAPDGAVVDADGTLWNARWGGWSLDGYAPDGTRTVSVRLPVAQPTCPAFAGAGLDRLVVTTARETLSEDALAGQPAAGAVLHVDLPVRGRPEPRVRLA